MCKEIFMYDELLYRVSFYKNGVKHFMRGYHNLLTNDYKVVIVIPHLYCDTDRSIEVYNNTFDTLEELKQKLESIYLFNEGKRINIEDFGA